MKPWAKVILFSLMLRYSDICHSNKKTEYRKLVKNTRSLLWLFDHVIQKTLELTHGRNSWKFGEAAWESLYWHTHSLMGDAGGSSEDQNVNRMETVKNGLLRFQWGLEYTVHSDKELVYIFIMSWDFVGSWVWRWWTNNLVEEIWR
jgi:hypothetical protein